VLLLRSSSMLLAIKAAAGSGCKALLSAAVAAAIWLQL
jgi:hypothetical protein